MKEKLVKGIKPILDKDLYNILCTSANDPYRPPNAEEDELYEREVVYLKCEDGNELSRFKDWTKTELF